MHIQHVKRMSIELKYMTSNRTSKKSLITSIKLALKCQDVLHLMPVLGLQQQQTFLLTQTIIILTITGIAMSSLSDDYSDHMTTRVAPI